MQSSELDEVIEKVTCEMLPARRCADGDRMHISNRLGLRDKAEQVSVNPESVTNYERRISKLMDEERVVQVTSIAPIPEFRQLIQNLIVVLLRTDRYFYWLVHGRSPSPRHKGGMHPGRPFAARG